MKSTNRPTASLGPGKVIDSHLHLVNLNRFQYYWIKSEFTVLQRNFLAEEIQQLYEAFDIERTVLVQAHPSVEETKYLVEGAAGHPFIAAIVAHIDLAAPTIEQDLSELSRHGIIRAVRHQRSEDQRADWFLEAEVLRGLKAVSAAGLRYDLLVKPQHLSSIPEVMAKVPEAKRRLIQVESEYVKRSDE